METCALLFLGAFGHVVMTVIPSKVLTMILRFTPQHKVECEIIVLVLNQIIFFCCLFIFPSFLILNDKQITVTMFLLIFTMHIANVLVIIANVFYLKNRIYVRSLIIDNSAQIIDKDDNVEFFIREIKFLSMTESELKTAFIEIIK